MQTPKTNSFLSDWGYHLVMLAVAIPMVGLAYLAWAILPTMSVSPPAPAATEAMRRNSLDVIAAFHSAGLDAEVVRGTTKDERDGFSTGMVVDARRFRISDKEGEMGMVLCFESPGDLAQMRNYYQRLNRALPQFGSWLFVKDNVLLQINHEVPEQTARAYAAVLETLDQ